MTRLATLNDQDEQNMYAKLRVHFEQNTVPTNR